MAEFVHSGWYFICALTVASRIGATMSEHDVAIFRERDRFQFTTSDLLLILAASFVGMALLVPVLFRDNRVTGCVTVEIGTVAGALIAMRLTHLRYPDRSSWLVCGIVFGWLCAILTYLIIPVHEQFLAIIGGLLLVFSPSILGAVISYLKVRRAEREKRSPKGIWTPVVVCATGNIVAIILLIILPTFLLRSRGPCCETAAASSCKAYAEAQEIYHRTAYAGDGVLRYAQHLKGDQSLLETTAGLGNLALIDKTFGNDEITDGSEVPKAGYVFKILKRQGPFATGGQMSYVDANGDMTQGYALVARPAAYNSTGRDTFMIGSGGIIFQADLGSNTAAIVDAMTEFDPDPKTWVPTQ